MQFIPADKVVQVQMIYNWAGQVVENVYHYKFDVTPIPSIMSDLAQDMRNWWDTEMKPGAPTNFVLTKVVCTDLSSRSAASIEYTGGLPLAGTSTQPALPNNVCVAVKWLTSLRGRSYRGSTYHMPILSISVTNNTISPASVAGLTANYTPLLTMTASLLNPLFVVVSRFSNSAPRTAAVVTPIIGISINQTVDSQRRRLPERGR
jgi:hypothetical protein